MTTNTKIGLFLIAYLLNELQKEKALNKYYRGLRDGHEDATRSHNL